MHIASQGSDQLLTWMAAFYLKLKKEGKTWESPQFMGLHFPSMIAHFQEKPAEESGNESNDEANNPANAGAISANDLPNILAAMEKRIVKSVMHKFNPGEGGSKSAMSQILGEDSEWSSDSFLVSGPSLIPKIYILT